MAAEVAYYTYIYAKVSKEHYQIVTSYTRTAILLGRFTSAAIAQTLVYFEIFDFKQLNYLSLSGKSILMVDMTSLGNNLPLPSFSRRKKCNSRQRQGICLKRNVEAGSTR